MFELTPARKVIMGLMNFRTGPIAHRLVELGHSIPRKAEEEQAYVLHWLLRIEEIHGDKWGPKMSEYLQGKGHVLDPGILPSSSMDEFEMIASAIKCR